MTLLVAPLCALDWNVEMTAAVGIVVSVAVLSSARKGPASRTPAITENVVPMAAAMNQAVEYVSTAKTEPSRSATTTPASASSLTLVAVGSVALTAAEDSARQVVNVVKSAKPASVSSMVVMEKSVAQMVAQELAANVRTATTVRKEIASPVPVSPKAVFFAARASVA